jgi:hypothetical protein
MLKFTASYSRSGGYILKDDMYTYHYFRNRSIIKPAKTADYLVQATVLLGLAYGVLTVVVMYR